MYYGCPSRKMVVSTKHYFAPCPINDFSAKSFGTFLLYLCNSRPTNYYPLKFYNDKFTRAQALNGEQSLFPDRFTKIRISFTPKYELTVSEHFTVARRIRHFTRFFFSLVVRYFHSQQTNEILDVTSETMQFKIRLWGSGVEPSCKITPDSVFNIIQITYENQDNTFTFQVSLKFFFFYTEL